MYTKHETKNCPRCNAAFECKSGSVLLCQCQAVILNVEQIEYMRLQYDDCLCAKCLLDLRKEYNNRQHNINIKKIVGRR